MEVSILLSQGLRTWLYFETRSACVIITCDHIVTQYIFLLVFVYLVWLEVYWWCLKVDIIHEHVGLLILLVPWLGSFYCLFMCRDKCHCLLTPLLQGISLTAWLDCRVTQWKLTIYHREIFYLHFVTLTLKYSSLSFHAADVKQRALQGLVILLISYKKTSKMKNKSPTVNDG